MFKVIALIMTVVENLNVFVVYLLYIIITIVLKCQLKKV